MYNSVTSTSNMTYSLLKKSMNVTVESNKVIANNIANINTKGYKRFYVPFDEILKNKESQAGMKVTREKHITNSSSDITIKRDDSTSMREDGNNVDLESEMTSQAANTMMYESLVRLVSGKLNATSSVIKGGGR